MSPAKKNRHRTAAAAVDATASMRPEQAVGARRSERLKSMDSPEEPTPDPGPAKTLQASTLALPCTVQVTKTKRKRSQDSRADQDKLESVHPSKELQKTSPPRFELSETNLRKFNGEEMVSSTNNSQGQMTSWEAEEARSQSSSSTTAYYRYKHLAAAGVYVHTDPPEDIQAAIDGVVKAGISEERRAELEAISRALYDSYKKLVRAAVGEDDFVTLFSEALHDMNHRGLCRREKADWREVLKPVARQPGLRTKIVANIKAMGCAPQKENEDASAPPLKRQRQSVGQTHIFPRSLTGHAPDPTLDKRLQESDAMPPLSQPIHAKAKGRFLVKTPRPDISMGAGRTAFISAFRSALPLQEPGDPDATEILEELEATTLPGEQGGPPEPMLIAMPTQRPSNLVFPFAVVESKAYWTGKQIFEAENQAAVSGASGLKMQLLLDELVKRSAAASSNPSTVAKDQPPLFFSICTEGPYHELWAHYTCLEHGVRKFNMTLLRICNSVLVEDLQDFIFAVDNVLRWGTGPFVDSVVERLVRATESFASMDD